MDVDLNLPLDSGGSDYTKFKERHGVPLDYVGQKLIYAYEELNRAAWHHHELRPAVGSAMYYLVVAYLALHNLLTKAKELPMVDRFLSVDSDGLDRWLEKTVRDRHVWGTAGIGLL